MCSVGIRFDRIQMKQAAGHRAAFNIPDFHGKPAGVIDLQPSVGESITPGICCQLLRVEGRVDQGFS